MKRAWLVIALLLSVGINIGVLATIGVARVRGERTPRSERFERFREGPPPAERLAERLELEGEDREQFVAQHQHFFETVQQVRMRQAEVRRELRQEVGSPSPDRARIDELLAQSSGLSAELERAFVDNVLAARELLDERQQRAYFGLLSRLRGQNERRRGMEGRRPGSGPGPGPPI